LCSGLTDGLLHALGDQWHPNPHSHSSLALGSTAAAQTIQVTDYLNFLWLTANVHINTFINILFAYLPLDKLQESKATPLLNYASNHKDIWGTRSITSQILYFNTTRKEWSVSQAPNIIWIGN
jgi:hypothetical protein